MNYVPADEFPEDNFENEDEKLDKIEDSDEMTEMDEIESLEDSDDVLIMEDTQDEGGFDEIIKKTEEAEVNAERATRKPFKKKGISKTKYNLLFYGSIFITIYVIAVIAIDKIVGINIFTAMLTWDWTIEKDKSDKDNDGPGGKIIAPKPKISEYERADNFVTKVLEVYDRVTKKRDGRLLADIGADSISEIREDYRFVISNAFETFKIWITLNIDGLRDKGYDEGDYTHKTDDKLTKKMAKLDEVMKILKEDKELDYIFAFDFYQDKQKEIDMLTESFDVLYEAKRPRTPKDKLVSMGAKFESNFGKRLDYSGELNGLYLEISDFKKGTPEFDEKLAELDKSANEYFKFYWSLLVDYYSYLKFAKDNGFTPDENIIRFGSNIEESFGMNESRLKESGSSLDRNTEFAKEMREKAEELKKEVESFKEETTEEDTDDDSGSSGETVTEDEEGDNGESESGESTTDDDDDDENSEEADE